VSGRERKRIPSANAIFRRTKKGGHLPQGTELDEICWQVHELLWLKVRPEFIICLGHGPGSSFEKTKLRLNAARSCEKQFPNGKRSFYIRWFEKKDVQVDVPASLVRVIGIPHPSWFDLGGDVFNQAWSGLSLLKR
jgi:hypothetical protein